MLSESAETSELHVNSHHSLITCDYVSIDATLAANTDSRRFRYRLARLVDASDQILILRSYPSRLHAPARVIIDKSSTLSKRFPNGNDRHQRKTRSSKHLPDTCCCNLGSIDRLPPRERISPWSRRDVSYPRSVVRWRFRISLPMWLRELTERNGQLLDFGSDKNRSSLANSDEPFAKGETPGLSLSMSSDSGSARAISLARSVCGYTRVRTRKEYADATLRNEGRGAACRESGKGKGGEEWDQYIASSRGD